VAVVDANMTRRSNNSKVDTGMRIIGVVKYLHDMNDHKQRRRLNYFHVAYVLCWGSLLAGNLLTMVCPAACWL
jgi:hypothetical protein